MVYIEFGSNTFLVNTKCDSRDLNPGYCLGKAMSYQARLLSHTSGLHIII